jgi:RNA polymerase primary sigma factor
MTGRLHGKRVAILACDGVDRRELTTPREALEAEGAHVELIAPMRGEIHTVEHLEMTGTASVDRGLVDADPARYDALMLPGGVVNPDRLRLDHDAVGFVRDFVAADKPVAAICHAPWLLIEAGLVRGRTVTSWPSLRTDLVNAGARWVDQEVCVDGSLITSRRPADLQAFCAKLIDLLVDPLMERSSPGAGGASASELDALVARGEESGCVQESEVDALAARLELGDIEVEELRERLAAAEVEVRDDCGKAGVPSTSYANGDLTHYTVNAMSQFLAEARRYPLLTAAEEIELAKRIERGDLEAKERLIHSNLRLVVSIAKRYQVSTHMTLLDLVQECTLGLIRATEKCDWRRGYKFSTHATFWIREAIQRGLDKKARVIRLPVALGQRERKIALAHRNLSTWLGREPTSEELAEATGLTVAEVAELADAPRVATSLDRPVGEEEVVTLGALLPATAPEVGEEVHLSLEREQVRRVVAQLAEPERSAIRLRYGLDDDGEPQTYTSIGAQLGLSADRIHTIEDRALRQLALHRELEGMLAA